jgi:hypothetical protein
MPMSIVVSACDALDTSAIEPATKKANEPNVLDAKPVIRMMDSFPGMGRDIYR